MKDDQTTRRCKKCDTVKPLEQFPIHDSVTGQRRHACIECNKARIKKHHGENYERRLQLARERYALLPSPRWTPEKKVRKNELAKVRGERLRDEVYAIYGARCACCGETETKFLTIDHVDNNGCEMRNHHGTGASFYKWLLKNRPESGFQILCMNCNFGKARNGGVCPHHTEGSTTRAQARTAKRLEAPSTLKKG